MINAQADPSGQELVVLSRDECLALLATVPVGRIVYTERALPAVQLVNFALADDTIVVRTAWGSKLAAAARKAIVAFEADSYDSGSRSGWSVTAVGQAHVVEEPDEIARLDTLPLQPWAPGRRQYYVRIAIEMLTGRQIIPAQHGDNGNDHIERAR